MISPLKLARLLKGVQQYKVCADLKIDTGSMSRYEAGLLIPSPKKQRRIAKYLGVEISDLWPELEPEIESSQSVLLGRELTPERLHFREESRPPIDPRIKALAEMAAKVNQSVHDREKMIRASRKNEK